MNTYTVTITGCFKVEKTIKSDSAKKARDAVFMALYENELNDKIVFNHDQIEVVDVTEDEGLF